MEETITFWLDNKICSGFKISEAGSQTLVSYRDKYYVVVNGAALMKGVRPLHYSKSSLPLLWKKAMKGILPALPSSPDSAPDDDHFLPAATSTKKERPSVKKEISPELDAPTLQPTVVTAAPKKALPAKPATEAKPVKLVQTSVTTSCPYCNHKQDIPFEKGKNGKPFFTTCTKCSVDFAVRFVPVTVYQAQVAAFK